MTLEEWLDKWLTEYMQGTVRDSTMESYISYTEKYIKPALGEKRVAFLTTAQIQKFYNYLRKNGRIKNRELFGEGLSDGMVGRIHCMLHEALGAAVREHLISKNPTDGTTVPKQIKKEMKVLTDEQLAEFMKAAEADEHWCDFFYTELTTGLRRGEICGLKWSDFDEAEGKLNISRSVDLRNGKITVGETKTGKGKRKFYLPLSTANVLRERKKNAVSEWIFADPICPELPIAPPAAYRKMKQLLKKAGLPDIRFHDLRHTFATHALTSGVDIKTLSTIIGHISSETTLNIYTHITDNMQRSAADKIERGFGRNEGTWGGDGQTPDRAPETPVRAKFEPKQPKIRRPGTGCIFRISEKKWEGSYSPKLPNGKRKKFNIYADTREECEE